MLLAGRWWRPPGLGLPNKAFVDFRGEVPTDPKKSKRDKLPKTDVGGGGAGAADANAASATLPSPSSSTRVSFFSSTSAVSVSPSGSIAITLLEQRRFVVLVRSSISACLRTAITI